MLEGIREDGFLFYVFLHALFQKQQAEYNFGSGPAGH